MDRTMPKIRVMGFGRMICGSLIPTILRTGERGRKGELSFRGNE